MEEYKYKKELVQAVDKNATEGVLRRLSRHPDYYIRSRVAVNLKTPTHILESFLNDEDYYVLAMLATNKNTPSRVLVSLYGISQDPRHKVFKRFTETAETAKLGIGVRNYLFEVVASNKNLPELLMVEATNHKGIGPRLGVVQNPNIPLRLLKTLAHDRYQLVSKIANKRLANRDYVV